MNLLANVIFDTWTSHEYDDDGGEKSAQTCRDERLLPCLRGVSVHVKTYNSRFAYQADGNQSRTSIPANDGELIGKPVER